MPVREDLSRWETMAAWIAGDVPSHPLSHNDVQGLGELHAITRPSLVHLMKPQGTPVKQPITTFGSIPALICVSRTN